MSVGWREPDLKRKKFEPFLVDLFTESVCWVCESAVVQERGCDFESSGKPLIANCNYLFGMHCTHDNVQQFLQLPEERHENWWLFLEAPPPERSQVTEMYGILEMNVERCKPYKSERIVQDKPVTSSLLNKETYIENVFNQRRSFPFGLPFSSRIPASN